MLVMMMMVVVMVVAMVVGWLGSMFGAVLPPATLLRLPPLPAWPCV
eukprot:COSAG01_NODE_2829_length_6998_cov_487.185824_5_plen_46_part_00